MLEIPIKARMTTWEDRPDYCEDRIMNNEALARKWAQQRSSEIKGKIELFSREGTPPFACYREGVDTMAGFPTVSTELVGDSIPA